MGEAAKKPMVIAVVGPTAVGKSEVAVALAKQLGAEIVSADSRQVYKEMRIGTARPSAQLLKEAPHHLVGTVSIATPYHAAQYEQEALAIIERLLKRGRYVALCGGSGLYVKALLEGFSPTPPVPPKIRSAVQEAYARKGLSWLQREVADRDPDFFAQVDQKNPRRLLRAVELHRATNMPMSALWRQAAKKRPFSYIKVGLRRERKELYRRIDQRVEHMMAAGLLEEAIALFAHRSSRALQTVGYRELFGRLEGLYTMEEAIRLIKQNTRRYAKRQLTWFGRDKEITWFHPDEWGALWGYVRRMADR